MKDAVKILAEIVVAVVLTGCQSILLDYRQYNGVEVTDAFLREPAARTFDLPPNRPPSTVRGRDKLVGRWQCHKFTNAKYASADSQGGRYGHTYRMESDVEYVFSEDGTLVLRTRYLPNEDWTIYRGTWSYAGNTLSYWLDGIPYESRITWYGDDEVLIKDVNLEQQSHVMGRAQHGNTKIWYDEDGCRHVDVSYDYAGGDYTSIESPALFKRKWGAQ